MKNNTRSWTPFGKTLVIVGGLNMALVLYLLSHTNKTVPPPRQTPEDIVETAFMALNGLGGCLFLPAVLINGLTSIGDVMHDCSDKRRMIAFGLVGTLFWAIVVGGLYLAWDFFKSLAQRRSHTPVEENTDASRPLNAVVNERSHRGPPLRRMCTRATLRTTVILLFMMVCPYLFAHAIGAFLPFERVPQIETLPDKSVQFTIASLREVIVGAVFGALISLSMLIAAALAYHELRKPELPAVYSTNRWLLQGSMVLLLANSALNAVVVINQFQLTRRLRIFGDGAELQSLIGNQCIAKSEIAQTSQESHASRAPDHHCQRLIVKMTDGRIYRSYGRDFEDGDDFIGRATTQLFRKK